MGKKKKNNGQGGGSRFFRWIKSDLPDKEEKKSPVLLLGVNKITDSPSFTRRRSIEGSRETGSIRFFRPPKSKYTRGLHGDERLEKIRQDLLTHKTNEKYIPSTSNDHELIEQVEEKVACLKLNCAGKCKNCENRSSNRGSFSFHRPETRHSSLCPSEPYGVPEQSRAIDYSENEIEFKFTEHIPTVQQPCSSKQNSSYNVTPKSAERRHFLLANLNERFRKTLSLDSRKIETNRVPLSLPQDKRPKSLVNTSNIISLSYKSEEPLVTPNFDKNNKPNKKKFRPKSFFSLETFFDSKKSDSSSVDDHSSSKYKRFELESDDSLLFRSDNNTPRSSQRREKTPDLLNLPIIIDSVRKRQSDPKKQLEKLENHYYRSLGRTVVDAIPKDATEVQGTSGRSNHIFIYDDDVEYIEPIKSNFTSQSTLILDSRNIPQDFSLKPDSVLTINTDETDIKLPSSTVSPKSATESCAQLENDLDSIGAYEIEVKEADLLKDKSKDLTVKIMDKSVDSIGSCSLDVDASTDFSDTTSGSLNLLTPSSTTSRIRDFTSRFQERAASANLQPNNRHLLAQASLNPSPAISPVRTSIETRRLELQKQSENLLKPPPKVVVSDSTSHRSRSHHKKRDEVPHKKPSYLNLACSVNGYTNLTTYDSKLRQDINKSREASPIRPITHTYQYKAEYNNSLVVPVPVSANKLLVPTFGPHDTTRSDLTSKAPTKAHTDPYLATSPLHVYMAAENKQLKNDFLGANMAAASGPYLSAESQNFASSMLHQKSDEVDNAIGLTFKSSYSETNFMSRKSGASNGQKTESRISSESYTIHNTNGVSKRVEITKENGEKLTSPMKSFIQQRVERLYGPGALAQGFFNQKRYKVKSQSEDEASESRVLTEKSLNCTNRFDQSYSPHRNKYEQNELYPSPNGETDRDLPLPVLRHLRPEFRAQLPILSPKKTHKCDVSPQHDIPSANSVVEESLGVESSDVRPCEGLSNGLSVISLIDSKDVVVDSDVCRGVDVRASETNGATETGARDAHYFIDLEKKETERLIAMAVSVEKELEILQRQDISEEVLGLLRSASGKARLLATQKMQQFEGLCYNNINERADEPFPTTVEDLQGFWDMVCLQVRNVNALFQQIDTLRENGWRETQTQTQAPRPRAAGGAGGAGGARRARGPAPPAPHTPRARLAADKREADRKAMLEHRRRLARERQMAERSSAGTSQEQQQDMGIEGSQEVEIFIGKGVKATKTAPEGDSYAVHAPSNQDS